MRRVLSAKVPNSPFTEMHWARLFEPTHMEGEDEDQENEKEDERDCEEIRRKVGTNFAHEAWRMQTTILSQCHL